jgi:hypothetical protein
MNSGIFATVELIGIDGDAQADACLRAFMAGEGWVSTTLDGVRLPRCAFFKNGEDPADAQRVSDLLAEGIRRNVWPQARLLVVCASGMGSNEIGSGV